MSPFRSSVSTYQYQSINPSLDFNSHNLNRHRHNSNTSTTNKMICTRCLRLRLRLHLSSPPLSHRLLYSTTRSPPPATSTSAAQPFSTPFTPSPYPSSSPTNPSSIPSPASHPSKSPPQQQQPQSSLKAGTPLKGLALEKNKEPPVAREDGEYPVWLWGLLGKKEGEGGSEEGGKGGGDAFCGSHYFIIFHHGNVLSLLGY